MDTIQSVKKWENVKMRITEGWYSWISSAYELRTLVVQWTVELNKGGMHRNPTVWIYPGTLLWTWIDESRT